MTQAEAWQAIAYKYQADVNRLRAQVVELKRTLAEERALRRKLTAEVPENPYIPQAYVKQLQEYTAKLNADGEITGYNTPIVEVEYYTDEVVPEDNTL